MRFPITTSLRFREQADPQWHLASTVNLSHTGVLFRADPPLPGIGQAVDLILTLPLDDMTPAQVRCTGHVVRTALQEFAGGGGAVAVTIEGYVFGGRVPVADEQP